MPAPNKRRHSSNFGPLPNGRAIWRQDIERYSADFFVCIQSFACQRNLVAAKKPCVIIETNEKFLLRGFHPIIARSQITARLRPCSPLDRWKPLPYFGRFIPRTIVDYGYIYRWTSL